VASVVNDNLQKQDDCSQQNHAHDAHFESASWNVHLVDSFFGRPPSLPFDLAALAFSGEVSEPPFLPGIAAISDLEDSSTHAAVEATELARVQDLSKGVQTIMAVGVRLDHA
jgi:hypothetical protein